MVRQNIGNWKKKYRPIITTESWSTEDERRAFVQQLKARPRFPHRELLEVVENAFAITDRQKKMEILETVGEAFLGTDYPSIPEGLMKILMSTPDPDIQRWLVTIMPTVCTDAVIPSLVQLLQHSNPHFHKIVRAILEKFNADAVADAIASELMFGKWTNRQEALIFLNEIAPDKVIGACRQALLIGREADKITSLKLLAQVRTPEAINTLAEHAGDPSDEIRFLIASLLGRIPGIVSVKTLIQLAQDKRVKIVVQALEGLRRLANPSSLSAIVRCANHENSRVRAASLAALKEIGTYEQIDLLVKGIKDADIHIRQSALDAITAICSRSEIDGTEMVTELLQDEDVNVRRAAAQILGSINAPAVLEKISEYLEDTDWWVRESIVQSLSKIKDPRVFPTALDLLQHPEAALRRYAIDILINQKNPDAVGPLTQLLKDQDWWVRERAVVALGLLGSKDTIALLAKLLTIPALARVAAEALGNIGHPSAIPPLIDQLPHVDSKSKLIFLNSLEKLHATDSIDILETYLDSSEQTVRIRVKEVLARLKTNPERLAEMNDMLWRKKHLSILDTMLVEARQQQASELILVNNSPVMLRIDGDLVPISTEIIAEDQILSLMYPLLNPTQMERFSHSSDFIFSHEIPDNGRYHGSLLRHSTGITLTFRVLPEETPTLDSLMLPSAIKSTTQLDKGLVLVTGPAKCGKTSTIAALINHINETRTEVVITLEDPIEYVHSHQNCFIIQREIGKHTLSFPQAIQSALREYANVLMIGEIRDAETLWMAITAADSGLLVLASMETPSVEHTLTTIIHSFPEKCRDYIRTLMTETLQVVVSQQLVPQQDSDNLVPALEILINTPTVASLIREDKIYQIPSVISVGEQHGMITMEQSLVNFVRQGLVTYEDASARSFDRKRFDLFYRKIQE
ncbi:MAG: PilT/PilU family type 4a pilus ATPase [bacterium]